MVAYFHNIIMAWWGRTFSIIFGDVKDKAFGDWRRGKKSLCQKFILGHKSLRIVPNTCFLPAEATGKYPGYVRGRRRRITREVSPSCDSVPGEARRLPPIVDYAGGRGREAQVIFHKPNIDAKQHDVLLDSESR